jgi:hypothetical protein
VWCHGGADAAAQCGQSRRRGEYKEAGGGGDGREPAGCWRGETAPWAAQEGHVDAVRVLVKVGAEVEAATDDDGSRPLQIETTANEAAWHGHVAVVKTLAELGADKEASAAGGVRPWRQVRTCGGSDYIGGAGGGHWRIERAARNTSPAYLHVATATVTIMWRGC